MSLFQKAIETYNNMAHLVGKPIEGKSTLAPIGFISKKIGQTEILIEITLGPEGDFVTAQPSEAQLLIPATQSSAGRTSSAAKMPHPLCDKLMYMLPQNTESFNAYITLLQEWCDSEDANEKAKAVLTYVKSGTIQNDLGELISTKKDVLICWRVLPKDLNDSESNAVWENSSLMDSYTRFYLKKIATSDTGLCYVSGEIVPLAEQHLKGVVSFKANAKLISANDNKNFTYLGRFLSDHEALSVGYEASQKAHNALKWIVDNDGVRIGDMMLVCWNPLGKKIPKPTYSLTGQKQDNEKVTPEEFKTRLVKITRGYTDDYSIDDEVVIAAFQASSDGRLSVNYYNELRAQEFVERFRWWDENCSWDSSSYGVFAPNMKSIVKAAFGVIRKNGEKGEIVVDDKVLSNQMQRLELCRMEKKMFPADIMFAAVRKCEMLQNYYSHGPLFEEQLFATCAIVRKYRYDHFKEEWSMALEETRQDRSYQYGRLLAIMEKIEKDTFVNGETREPNAIRMLSVFTKRPAYATRVIIEKLKNSAYPRLSVGSRTYYDKMIGDIMTIISDLELENFNKPLSETYLLGYYLQKKELYTKKTDNKKEEE